MVKQLQRAVTKQKQNLLLQFDPYDKQLAFLNAGATQRVRAFMAGNRCGKTYAGSMEGAMHLTGIYPTWWKGKRFDKPIKAWAGSDTTESTRDILQEAYLGGKNEEDHGTGTIPKENIVKLTKRQGVADAVDTIWVRHSSGGLSEITFKSYDQGRKKWQGTNRDFIQLDEEPPTDIWAEAFTRTMNVKGLIVITFTPLNGLTEICEQIMAGRREVTLPSGKKQAVELGFYQAGWADAPYLTEDDMAQLLAGIPTYEVEARMRGIPSAGRGRVYPYREEDISCEPFPIPSTWQIAFGLDFGLLNTAAVFGAYDENTGIWYIYDEYKAGCDIQNDSGTTGDTMVVEDHATALKIMGADKFNGVCDPAGRQRESDGVALMDKYTDAPNLLSLTTADNAVSAGLATCNTAFKTGRLKIFTTCRRTLNELSKYSRDDKGNIKKKDDHLMDSMRYLIVSGQPVAKLKDFRERVINRMRNKVGSWLTV